MAASLFFMPFPVAFNSNGLPVAGGKIYFYGSGGTTAAPVYTTSALNVQHTQPVVADGAGRFSDIYLDSTVTYRVIIKDAAGVTLQDVDPYSFAGLIIGTSVQAYDADLAALAANSTNGIWTRTGDGTGAARTITGTANEITVTNGSGVAGNPTLSLPTPIKTHTVSLLVTDPNGDALTTGDGKALWPVPSTINGCDLVAVAAALGTASSSGAPTIQIRNATQAADMLSTRITVDANETHSKDAAAAAVIDAANDDVATGDMLAIDVDVAGTGTKGLCVEMQFRLP